MALAVYQCVLRWLYSKSFWWHGLWWLCIHCFSLVKWLLVLSLGLDVPKYLYSPDQKLEQQRSRAGKLLSAVMSSLSPCNLLMVPELFCDILDSFHPEVEPGARQALVSLAQTCRAFSEPSLNRLWRKLYSLKPLIRCYTAADNLENAVPPTSSQFAIIDRYSHRIRELAICESTSVRFLQCMSMRPSCLFPNLMVLKWGAPYIASPYTPIIFVQRLLSHTLVSLEATLAEADGATLLSFLDNYPLLCRNLKSIEFRFSAGVHSETTIQTLSRAICSQQTLENVVLHAPIDGIALRHLSTLPTLKMLSATLSEGSTAYNNIFSPTDSLFCSAEELEFAVWDLDLVTTLLRPHNQIFHTFRLYHQGRQTIEALLTFINVLTSRSHTNPLRDLTLSVGDFAHPIPADQMANEVTRYRLSFKILQPLMVLQSLRDVIIEWSEQISLDDDELEKLARSWPLLRVFNVYCGRGGYPPFSTKYATLRGLLMLVSTCRELQVVSLPLDARQMPVIKETEPCETNFTCLIVSESPIDQALPVAEFLFKYLPCLTAVDARFLRPPGTDGQQITAYELAWQQVETHLEEFHYSSFDSGFSLDSGDSEGSDE